MAGQGFKDFTVGEVLTSADVDGYLMQQSVMRFADSAARGSALGTAVGTAVPLAEGMLSYLDDTNSVEVYDGTAWGAVGPSGYTYDQTIYYTSNATWTKADYQDIAAVLVEAVGGGGGGGGSGNSDGKCGAGGGGGAYARTFVTAASLGSTETVTIGAGGSGGTTTGSGAAGTDSSFGTHCVADGGSGGDVGSGVLGSNGGAGGLAANCTGDLKVDGSGGHSGTAGAIVNGSPAGGDSRLGAGGRPRGFNGDGYPGVYGGGGSGGYRWTVTSRAGGAGGNGLVVVHIFK